MCDFHVIGSQSTVISPKWVIGPYVSDGLNIDLYHNLSIVPIPLCIWHPTIGNLYLILNIHLKWVQISLKSGHF